MLTQLHHRQGISAGRGDWPLAAGRQRGWQQPSWALALAGVDERGVGWLVGGMAGTPWRWREMRGALRPSHCLTDSKQHPNTTGGALMVPACLPGTACIQCCPMPHRSKDRACACCAHVGCTHVSPDCTISTLYIKFSAVVGHDAHTFSKRCVFICRLCPCFSHPPLPHRHENYEF